MAYNPNSQELLDTHNGQADLMAGDLRLVNPEAFKDDPLRMVRGLVSVSRFGLTPDSEVVDSMEENAHRLRDLPGERIQMELDKMMAGSDPASAMELAAKTGMLDYMAPELSSTIGFDQMNPHHNLNVFDHTMQVLRKMTSLTNDPDLRLAALFHDSGKPDSFWRDESAPEGGGGHFYKKKLDNGTFIGEDHEDVGADLANVFMSRLRYPNNRRERVVTLIRNHMFPYFKSEKGARKFLAALGNDPKMAFDLLTLREADASGKIGGEPTPFDAENIAKDRELLQQVIDSQAAVSVRDLAVNGHDLASLGLQGREIGDAQKRLLDAVIDDPSLNDRDTLMQMAAQWKN
jgi:tRNA nucleotidyltransferase (CCA-adding enzyme)